MHNSHFKPGMVLHVAYRIYVHQLTTSCFTTLLFVRHNIFKCWIFFAFFLSKLQTWYGVSARGPTHRLLNSRLPVIYSLFYDLLIFRHNMVKCQVFVTLSSATLNRTHFTFGMVLSLGVLHIAYGIHARQLFTSCFTTYFIFRHNMVKCQIFVAFCGGILNELLLTDIYLDQRC